MIKDLDGRTLHDALSQHGIRHERDYNTTTDGKHAWFDRSGYPLGRFDVVEGWQHIRELEVAT